MATKPGKTAVKKSAAATTMSKGATKKVATSKTAVKGAPKTAVKKVSAKALASKEVSAESKKVRKVLKPSSATGAYTQTEFLENVRAFCGMDKRSQAKELMMDLSELITEALKKGYKVPIPGIGKMLVRKTKAREMPKPGDPSVRIKVPAKKKVRFTPAKTLKEAVL